MLPSVAKAENVAPPKKSAPHAICVVRRERGTLDRRATGLECAAPQPCVSSPMRGTADQQLLITQPPTHHDEERQEEAREQGPRRDSRADSDCCEYHADNQRP
jgi:hypothetical protein